MGRNKGENESDKVEKNVDVQKIRFDKEREKVDGQKKTVKGVIQLHYWAKERTVKTENSEKWIILILWPQSKDTKDRQ